ncbi:response regulator [Deferribacter thermophilus]|uniref:response regulator n=1 Tax=Deferribacter thermophilus TaxID=53573 RepID=UPI003C2627F5
MKTVLVVDDDPSIRLLLRDELSDLGLNVMTAVDGEEALISFEENNIDLIVLDLSMPKLEGDKVLEVIAKKSEIPVIIYSANIDNYKGIENIHKNSYLIEKTANLSNLINVINSIIND